MKLATNAILEWQAAHARYALPLPPIFDSRGSQPTALRRLLLGGLPACAVWQARGSLQLVASSPPLPGSPPNPLNGLLMRERDTAATRGELICLGAAGLPYWDYMGNAPERRWYRNSTALLPHWFVTGTAVVPRKHSTA